MCRVFSVCSLVVRRVRLFVCCYVVLLLLNWLNFCFLQFSRGEKRAWYGSSLPISPSPPFSYFPYMSLSPSPPFLPSLPPLPSSLPPAGKILGPPGPNGNPVPVPRRRDERARVHPGRGRQPRVPADRGGVCTRQYRRAGAGAGGLQYRHQGQRPLYFFRFFSWYLNPSMYPFRSATMFYGERCLELVRNMCFGCVRVDTFSQ